MTEPIEPLGGETVFEGKTFSVRVERLRQRSTSSPPPT